MLSSATQQYTTHLCAEADDLEADNDAYLLT